MSTSKLSENGGENTQQVQFNNLIVIARHHNTTRHNLPPVSAIERNNNGITHAVTLQGIAQG